MSTKKPNAPPITAALRCAVSGAGACAVEVMGAPVRSSREGTPEALLHFVDNRVANRAVRGGDCQGGTVADGRFSCGSSAAAGPLCIASCLASALDCQHYGGTSGLPDRRPDPPIGPPSGKD